MRKRSSFLSALIAGLGLVVSVAPTTLHGQTDNFATINVITNGTVESTSGSYNNFGVINFNGPLGAAAWRGTNQINNVGTVTLNRADLGISGNVANTGTFQIANLGGIVQVDGSFTNSGTAGVVNINGGGMTLDAINGVASFTNQSTAATGVSIDTNRYLIADSITNGSGATISNLGRLESREGIINYGTINSQAATSILKGADITNNGTINARGNVEGNVTNNASRTFAVTNGNLVHAGNFDNHGTLAVTGGNMTAVDINNNVGGTISVGAGSMLSGTRLDNDALITVGAGGTVRSTGTNADFDELTNRLAGTITFNGTTGTANLSSAEGTIENRGTINLNAGTVVRVTGDLSGTGIVNIFNGATFITGSADQSIDNSVTIAGTSTFDTDGFDATVYGNVTGAGGLTKNGLGNLTLEGTNTFSSASTINAGQLTLKGGNAFNDSSALTVGAAGKLKIEGSETIGSLAGLSGSETTLDANLTTGGNNASTIYAGTINGTGRLSKNGAGTMTMSGTSPNSFSGGVNVNDGTLAVMTNEQLGTGNVNVATDSRLTIASGTTQSVNGVIVDGTVENAGTINSGVTGMTNYGVVNSDTATSAITGGLVNSGTANLRNQISGAIVNESDIRSPNVPAIVPTITVMGNLTGNGTLQNRDSAKLHVKDGDFTGITTLTNQSTNAAGVQIDANRTLAANAVTNGFGSTIVNAGTLTSTTAITNSGTITNQQNAIVNGGINNVHANALVTNNGTINGGGIPRVVVKRSDNRVPVSIATVNGGITGNFGTVNSISANSVINGGVNNSGYVNARNIITGPIINYAQHSFTDVTLTHARTNASGTVTFGVDDSIQTFNLQAASGATLGAEGNGVKNVEIVFGATTLAGTSTYSPSEDKITVYVADLASTNVAAIQSAINNGSGFTASGGNSGGTVSDVSGSTSSLVGGRNSGTALIRVLADATGTGAKDKTVTIVNDASLASNTTSASIDSATGNIRVSVNGDVSHHAIANAINNLDGFNATVTSSMGDNVYRTALDTPPPASTLGNGQFNVVGDLAVNNTFTNGGDLNLINSNLTGITTLTNTGDISVADQHTLQAGTVLNTTGDIDLGYDSTLQADSITNSSTIDVSGRGKVLATATITNEATGVMTFGLGMPHLGDVSELKSDTNTIVNNGTIDVTKGTLKTTGNISGTGTIKLADGTTFQAGNNDQTITNSIALADGADGGASIFNTAGNNATVSGTVSGASQLVKSGVGTLTLSGTNTFTGQVVINQGQLQLQGGSAIADSTDVRLNAGSLQVSSSETIGALTTAAGTQTFLDATLTTGGNNTNTFSSGVLSGAGGLVKQGTGTMILNGTSANTHAGGTTVNGGVLRAWTNEQLGTGIVIVGAGGTLSTAKGTAQTVAGLTNQGIVSIGTSSVLNTGSSHLNNSGTVNVGSGASVLSSGSITNSGTMNFAGGTSELSSGTNSITNTGTINLNAGTVLVKGDIAGSGLINMNNGTTLRSGSANQQIASGINVNSGTAVIDSNGNNVNLTGTITGQGTLNKVGAGNLTWAGVNNGNAFVSSGLIITSTQSQVGNVELTNGSGVIFDQNTHGIYAGSVTGDGTLTKTGEGIVTMMGNSSYSGGTNILQGTLRVGNQGVGQVNSHMNVANGGTLGGGGTIVGNVDTQQGGRIAAGNSIGTLNISGNLNASGSVIENELNGTTSDLVNVSGTANIAGARLENQFDPTASYTTRMYRALNATGGVTGRFASVTNVSAPSDFLISTYYTPTTANVVLTSLADATLASSTSTSLLSNGQDYLTSIMTQLNSYQFGGFSRGDSDQQQVGRNVWFKGIGFFNDFDAMGAAPGYSTNAGGGIVGVDRVLNDNTRLGIAGGYTMTALNMRNAGRSNAEIDSTYLNLYGAHSFHYFTLSGIGGYGYHNVEADRNLLGIGLAESTQSQHEASLNFQLTLNPMGEIQSFMPYVGIQWVSLSQNAYAESGTPGFDMSFAKSTADSLRPYVGMGYQYRIVRDSGLVTIPYLFSRYSQETITNSNITNLSINGTNFSVAGVRPNSSIVGLGGGINAQLRQNIDWSLSCGIDLGDRSTNHNATGGFGFTF